MVDIHNISTDTLIAYCNISAEYFTESQPLLPLNIMNPCCLNIQKKYTCIHIYLHNVHCTMLLHNDGVMLRLTRLNVFPACTIYICTYYTYCTTHWVDPPAWSKYPRRWRKHRSRRLYISVQKLALERGGGRSNTCIPPPRYHPSWSVYISFEDDVTTISHHRCFLHGPPDTIQNIKQTPKLHKEASPPSFMAALVSVWYCISKNVYKYDPFCSHACFHIINCTHMSNLRAVLYVVCVFL